MGWRCRIKLSPPATVTAANTRNTAICGVMILFLSPCWSSLCPHNRETGNHHVDDGQRQQQFPAEAHQLVVPKARKRAAHPDINEKENGNFQQEPKRSLNELDDSRQSTQKADAA